MNIPMGRKFDFTIKVLQPGSLTPLDVTLANESATSAQYSGKLHVFAQSAPEHEIFTVDLVPVPVSTEIDPDGNPQTVISGLMSGTFAAADTAGLQYSLGDSVDGYPVRAEYAGYLEIIPPTVSGVTYGLAVNARVTSIGFYPTGAA